MAETEAVPASRYERVKYILDQSHQGSAAEYQGNGRFWQLPLERFLAVVIYGVRMIAPGDGTRGSSAGKAQGDTGCCSSAMPPPPARKDASGCCGGGDSGGGGATPSGRGAASGLIKGLRGQYPFDGSVLPRIPWGGGTVVAESDIAFIEAWIDDGCPADDTSGVVSGTGDSSKRLALAHGDVAHPLAMEPVNEIREKAGTLKVRKNVEALTAEELRRLRRAIGCMKAYDSYSRDERSFAYWARIHANNCQHGWEEFLSWHRLYLHYFEQRLQDIDPSVTLPYWDWTTSYAFNRTVDTFDGGTIPEAFCCFVDEGVISDLTGKVPDETLTALKKIATPGQSFCSGPRLFAAAGISYDASAATDTILTALGRANPLWHRLRWPGGQSASAGGLLFEDYPSPEDIENILGLDGFFAFGSGPDNNHFFGAVENVHNLMHNFSGGSNPNKLPNEPKVGDMVNSGVTAFDPIFWAHHTNIDRLWAEWQKRHPGQVPDDLSAILAPWPGNVGDTLQIAALGYDYALSTHTFSTDATTSIVRFKSAMAQVPARVIERHRRAEVQLAKVQHMQKGGIIRVFMNQPDASADTPTRGNPCFVGQMHMFAAECIGGPGHCDVPPETTRKFDTRPRHRKTPHNIRFDATKTIERLRAAGETDFHVQVVAIDTRGAPSAEVLRLDGVSLVFFD